MIKVETFEHSAGIYRGAQILPCEEFPHGLTSSHGVLELDINNLVRWAYEAGVKTAAANVAEMNEQLTKNTLGAQSRIAALETVVRQAGLKITAANDVKGAA